MGPGRRSTPAAHRPRRRGHRNRNATEQALTRADAFATAVAEAGHTVTATLAYGVDSAAHRAAARAGRATLAVLPCGLDRAHPHDHAHLLRSIPANGSAVLSLYRPGTAPSATSGLLAALARTVILIEALDHAEAAMRTAEAATALRRPPLSPPAAEDVRADGTARLLTAQRAVLVPDPARALALL
ncbi:DNA-processing protein DprA [Streptomyces sp. MN13]